MTDINSSPEWAIALAMVMVGGVEQEVWLGQLSYAYTYSPEEKYQLGKPNTFSADDFEIIESI